MEVVFDNFLQAGGVVPGVNTLSAGVEASEEVRVRRVTVFEDSGVEATRRSPPQVSLEVAEPELRLQAGDVSPLRFTVTNRGGYPVKVSVVNAVVAGDSVQVRGEDSWRFPTVESAAEGVLYVEALRPGPFEVTVSVSGATGGHEKVSVRGQVG